MRARSRSSNAGTPTRCATADADLPEMKAGIVGSEVRLLGVALQHVGGEQRDVERRAERAQPPEHAGGPEIERRRPLREQVVALLPRVDRPARPVERRLGVRDDRANALLDELLVPRASGQRLMCRRV